MSKIRYNMVRYAAWDVLIHSRRGGAGSTPGAIRRQGLGGWAPGDIQLAVPCSDTPPTSPRRDSTSTIPV